MPVFGEKISRRTPGNAAELLVVQTKMFGDRRRGCGGEIRTALSELAAIRVIALGHHALRRRRGA